MPKKKTRLTPEEQAKQFADAVRTMEAAGELNPTEADKMFDKAMAGVAKLRRQWFDGESDSESPS